MILTGHEDLRVIKTIESIKENFQDLICEKPYEKITVKELCDRARINKKTFYHYYETLDALLVEMQQEMSRDFIERIKGYQLPADLDKVNREFFLYSAEQGEAYEKITLNAGWQGKRDEMIGRVNAASWAKSSQYQKLSDFEKGLLLDFIGASSLSAYRRWVESGKKMAIDDVVDTLNRLQLGGVREFFGLKR